MRQLYSPLSSSPKSSGLTIIDGLRSFHTASAFLPTLVIEGCNAQLDEIGFDFVKKCIRFIEVEGMKEHGIYRNCGVSSKVKEMMRVGLERRKVSDGKSWIEESEWDSKTVSSALKSYLRNLPEPLMTFDLHSCFISAAKKGDRKQRLQHIHYYVYQLPKEHKEMLEMVIRHLKRVADSSRDNLMTAGNLSVCFGPTLLRPKEETVAAVRDITFCNVVVEILIAHAKEIFDSPPPPFIESMKNEGVRDTCGTNIESKEDRTGEKSEEDKKEDRREEKKENEVIGRRDKCIKVAVGSDRMEEKPRIFPMIRNFETRMRTALYAAPWTKSNTMPPKKKLKTGEVETVETRQPAVSATVKSEETTKVIHLKVSQFSSWELNTDSDLSPEVNIHGTRWGFYATRKLDDSDGDDSSYLEIHLRGFDHSILAARNSNLWSMNISVKLTLISTDSVNNRIFELESKKKYDRSVSLSEHYKITGWKELEDEGLINDDTLNMEMQITTSNVLGLRKTPSFDFTVPHRLHDLTLVLQGKRIYANRGMLANHSPFFEGMLYGELDESKKDEFPLDADYDDFLELLAVLYPSKKEVTDDNVEMLLELSHFYQMNTVLDQVEKHLIGSSGFTTAAKLKLAGQYTLVRLQGNCIGWLESVQEVQNLKTAVEYKDFDDQMKLALFERMMKLE